MEAADFRNPAYACQSLFRMLLGDLDTGVLFDRQPVVGPCIYFLFVARSVRYS
jgi:hypothetical protein